MRANAATLTYRMPVQRTTSQREPRIRERAVLQQDEITPFHLAADHEELDRQLARFEDPDTGSERMVGGLVMLVVILYAVGMAWLLLPIEGIVAAVRQL